MFIVVVIREDAATMRERKQVRRKLVNINFVMVGGRRHSGRQKHHRRPTKNQFPSVQGATERRKSPVPDNLRDRQCLHHLPKGTVLRLPIQTFPFACSRAEEWFLSLFSTLAVACVCVGGVVFTAGGCRRMHVPCWSRLSLFMDCAVGRWREALRVIYRRMMCAVLRIPCNTVQHDGPLRTLPLRPLHVRWYCVKLWKTRLMGTCRAGLRHCAGRWLWIHALGIAPRSRTTRVGRHP